MKMKQAVILLLTVITFFVLLHFVSSSIFSSEPLAYECQSGNNSLKGNQMKLRTRILIDAKDLIADPSL